LVPNTDRPGTNPPPSTIDIFKKIAHSAATVTGSLRNTSFSLVCSENRYSKFVTLARINLSCLRFRKTKKSVGSEPEKDLKQKIEKMTLSVGKSVVAAYEIQLNTVKRRGGHHQDSADHVCHDRADHTVISGGSSGKRVAIENVGSPPQEQSLVPQPGKALRIRESIKRFSSSTTNRLSAARCASEHLLKYARTVIRHREPERNILHQFVLREPVPCFDVTDPNIGSLIPAYTDKP
jgi:hypothetical protein